MTLEIKKYVPKRSAIEAVFLTPDNAEEVARWCGGEYGYVGNNVSPTLRIPTLREEAIKTFTNTWVTKDENGRFDWTTAELFERLYDKVDFFG